MEKRKKDLVMLNENKKVKFEFVNTTKKTGKEVCMNMTNPRSCSIKDTEKLSYMVQTILEQELPMLKNNAFLHDLVLYTLLEKVKTVQTVKNVLSYIKESDTKQINDVRFQNGEIYIECSI